MIPMFGTQSVTFWYPTSFPQFRTIVRPPTSPPLISYFSTTSQPLPTPIPNPKRDGEREGGEGARALRDHRVSPATTSRVRRTSFRQTDRSKAIGERAARRTSALPRAPDL